MLRALVFSLLCLVPAVARAACDGPNLIDALSAADRAELDALVRQHPYPEGNLWLAEKPGSSVLVVGTIHTPDPRLSAIAERSAAFLESAEILVLEATADMQRELQRSMIETPEIAFITEGPTLIDLLGDELWKTVSADLTERGIPPFIAAKFQPWLLAMTLSVPACALTAMAEGEPGLDAMLETQARGFGVATAELDDLQALYAILNSGTTDEQIRMLRMSVLGDWDQEAAYATLVESYFAGRHREVFEFNRLLVRNSGIPEADSEFDRFEEQLLKRRNRDWEPKIAALVDGRRAVVAVGAAHLSGETGVLRALERQGYALSPY